MTRRRLVLAACVAVAALAAAWWMFSDRASADERRLFGDWALAPQPAAGHGTWHFGEDRVSHRTRNPDENGDIASLSMNSGKWAVRNGAIVLDCEPNSSRRDYRWFFRLIGQPCLEPLTFALESVSDDQLAVVAPDGTREVWTRDCGD